MYIKDMKTNRKILNFDTETTGLYPNTNGLVQLAGVIEINDKEVEEFDFKLKPFPDDIIDEESLKIHGHTKEEIMGWDDPISIHEQLVEILDKYVDRYDPEDKYYPCGYNTAFDISFLINYFKKCNNQFIGSWLKLKAQIDPLPILRMLDFMGQVDLSDYKLETVADALGIPIKAHDALSDIKATIEIRKIVEQLITCD